MSCIVPRTCTEIRDGGGRDVDAPRRADRGRDAQSRPLDVFRAAPAYVLLGDPGAGKSTAFQSECDALGETACFVTARDFLTFDPGNRPEWQGKTLFIDGLDEIRAGTSDTRPPFDSLRGRLDALGRPRFRLSCRAADWLGSNDRKHLAAVSPDTQVTVLRLDPLTDDDVVRILEAHADVDDAGTFLALAREKGVDGFLENPQSLDMLAQVVGSAGNWPESRLELFEHACRKMVQEHNEEHRAARAAVGTHAAANAHAPDDLLNAAGRLCAVQLTAGLAGYSLNPNEADDAFPAVEACGLEWNAPNAPGRHAGGGPDRLRGALATKLFASAGPMDRFRPVHRHVAEFLAARYLARLIGGPGPSRRGLPARRVLSLITGGDGVVVTALRGLSAWLAACSPEARRDLIARDPIGVGLYGDVSGFLPDEKHAILESLGHAARQLAPVSRFAAAFAPLADAAMEPEIKSILTDASRDRERQEFAHFLLNILYESEPRPGLAHVLFDIIRDETRLPHVNRAALDAFIRTCPDDRELPCKLRTLLADVQAGRVQDPDDQLRGTLLMHFYPGELSPAEVWKYCSVPPKRFAGRYPLFGSDLSDRIPAAHVAEHLDVLAAASEGVQPVLEGFGVDSLGQNLLARGLDQHGDEIEPRRLYDWLGVGLVPIWDNHSSASAAVGRIRSWLERHGEIQKAVITEGMKRSTDSGGGPIEIAEVHRRLYQSNLPADFGLWCLEHAGAATDRRVAKDLLAHAVDAVDRRIGDDGLSLEILIARTRGHPVLKNLFAELSVCPLDTGDNDYQGRHHRLEERARRRREEQGREHQVWIEHVRSHRDMLLENRYAPNILHQIAQAYFGDFPHAVGADPPKRLRRLFRDDDALIEAAMIGLRGALCRSDLPDVDEIIRLRDRNLGHWLALPFVAGLAELERTAPDDPDRPDERQLRIALALRFCGMYSDRQFYAVQETGRPLSRHGRSDAPAWYQRLLASRAELVADILIRSAASAIRQGWDKDAGGYTLPAESEDHSAVARIASLPLLCAFPIRCAERQIRDLHYLLRLALRYADRGAFTALIERRLSRPSMNVAQRAGWLAAGLTLSPKAYLQPVEEFTAAGERRIRHLAAFFEDWRDRDFPIDRLGTGALRLLVRLAGSSFAPCWPTEEMTKITFESNVSYRVRRMIQRLAESPAEDAGTALEALSSDPALARWREELIGARDRQRVIQRDAAYRHPGVDQVCRTLNDGAPANPSDLAALVVDRLDEIAVRIRTGNTNDWRQYWNELSHRKPSTPKHEESCRDALLSDLQQRLPDGIDAQPEVRYANDKRADIRIACRDFQVPIEIKKNTHPDLWSAPTDQLIDQYTQDPATGGFGIYLVLWFGDIEEHRTPKPPSGDRPHDPTQLEKRLEARLKPDEKRKISVRVIDVRAPGATGVS